jgi:hypothetical protein
VEKDGDGAIFAAMEATKGTSYRQLWQGLLAVTIEQRILETIEFVKFIELHEF